MGAIRKLLNSPILLRGSNRFEDDVEQPAAIAKSCAIERCRGAVLSQSERAVPKVFHLVEIILAGALRHTLELRRMKLRVDFRAVPTQKFPGAFHEQRFRALD